MKRFREWLIPELRREPIMVRHSAAYQHGTNPGWAVWMMCGVIPAGLFSLCAPDIFRTMLAISSWGMFAFMATMACYAFVWSAIGFALLRSRIRRKARTHLRLHGMAICVPCGYDLTGNTNGICPECGAAGSVEYEAWKAE